MTHGISNSQQIKRVIAVTGGKGGVGKTNLALNLAIALAKQQSVMLVDADYGLANIDVLLGLTVAHTLYDVVQGHCSLQDIIVSGPHGVQIIPGRAGIHDMMTLSAIEQNNILHAFTQLSQPVDTLFIDLAAGISPATMQLAQACDEVLLVVCHEPTSIADAYAVIKVLHQHYGVNRFRLLANMVRSNEEGLSLYKKLSVVTDRFLDIVLSYTGAVPYDECLRQAVKQRKAVIGAYPSAQSSLAIQALAERIRCWPNRHTRSSSLSGFFDKWRQGITEYASE